MISTIAGFETRTLSRSPQSWLLAAVLALLFAYLFLQALESFLELQPSLSLQDHPTGLAGYLSIAYQATLVMVFALVAPLLAMRSFSEEYRQNTMPLWQSSPVSSTSLVVGKFLGVACIVTLLVLLANAMPLAMLLFTPLDVGVWASAMLGMWLSSMMFCAVGLFFSSLTRHPIIAVVGSVLLLLLLWLIGDAGIGNNNLSIALEVFSIPTHLGGFFQGFLK